MATVIARSEYQELHPLQYHYALIDLGLLHVENLQGFRGNRSLNRQISREDLAQLENDQATLGERLLLSRMGPNAGRFLLSHGTSNSYVAAILKESGLEFVLRYQLEDGSASVQSWDSRTVPEDLLSIFSKEFSKGDLRKAILRQRSAS